MGASSIMLRSDVLLICTAAVQPLSNLSPDDEVGAPLGVLIERIVHFVQHAAEFPEVEGFFDLGKHVRLGILLLRSGGTYPRQGRNGFTSRVAAITR